MATTEILVVGLSPSDPAATGLFHRLRTLGTDVARVGRADSDMPAVAAEVRSALQRRPGLLFLMGAELAVMGAGIAAGSERSISEDLPAGAVPLAEGAGFTMLVASTYVVAVAGGAVALDAAWSRELGACLAEWVGRPVHVRGELVVLDGGPVAVEQLLALVSVQHPEVYLRAEPADGAGVRVCALAAAEAPNAAGTVDVALAAVERAAGVSRLRIASTGHKPGQRVDHSVQA